MKLNHIKGALFEIIILKLVLMSGYRLISPNPANQNRIRRLRRRFLEIKGRGEWHQIDIPVDLKYLPSFIYPIRLLGEVKYYNRPLDKSLIRVEIGKMKDIQENYFVASGGQVTSQMRAERRIETFAFFSASGFNISAERLAYAHGIKTISYLNNKVMKQIIGHIDSFANQISMLESEEDQAGKLDSVYDELITENNVSSSLFIGNSDNHAGIKTSIIGTTSSGLVIHFLSMDDFPNEQFLTKDEALCSVRTEEKNNGEWYLQIRGTTAKFFFSMPEIILKECFATQDNVLIYPRKAYELETIYFYRVINGCERLLKFKFDHEWFSGIIHNNSRLIRLINENDDYSETIE